MFGTIVDKAGLNEGAILHANMKRAYVRSYLIVGLPELIVAILGEWYGWLNGFPLAFLGVIALIGTVVTVISVWAMAQMGPNYGAEVGPSGVIVYERLITSKRVAMRQVGWEDLGLPKLAGRGSVDLFFDCRVPPVFVSPEQAVRILFDPRYPLKDRIPNLVLDRLSRYRKT